jgi:hypothetical protein
MVSGSHIILGKLRTQIARTTVRMNVYSHQYEAFRKYPVCANDTDRELQMNIAYLYHTSLSMLEERRKSLEDYCEDVKDVLASFASLDEITKREQLQTDLFKECREEIISLQKELREIDASVAMARRHEIGLMS